MRGEQRTGPVEHDDPSRGERAKRPEAVFDAIQPDHDVEPPQSDRSRQERRARLLGRQDARVDAARGCGGEGGVRGRPTLSDKRKKHTYFIAQKLDLRGLSKGEDRVRFPLSTDARRR